MTYLGRVQSTRGLLWLQLRPRQHPISKLVEAVSTKLYEQTNFCLLACAGTHSPSRRQESFSSLVITASSSKRSFSGPGLYLVCIAERLPAPRCAIHVYCFLVLFLAWWGTVEPRASVFARPALRTALKNLPALQSPGDSV